MSKWIDADALKKTIDREIFRHDTIDHVFQIIDDAPSIDIVFCKECKHAHMTYGGDCKYCDMWKDDDDFCIELYLDGDFYCAYGDRKESE